MHIIHLTHGDLHVYEHIDGHRYGVVFSDEFPLEHGLEETCTDFWGFGKTKTDAISNLFAIAEEWAAIYQKQYVRFVRPMHVTGGTS